MKFYEILPTHTETPRNTSRKISNLYIEFNYHFLALQKKNPITFEQECTRDVSNKRVTEFSTYLTKTGAQQVTCSFHILESGSCT